MPRCGPIKRNDLVRFLKQLGFQDPYSGGKHHFMVKGDLTLRIPNPHKGDIGESQGITVSAAFLKRTTRLVRKDRIEIPLVCFEPLDPRNLHCSSGIIGHPTVIRKLKSGEYRLYSRKKDPKTGKRKNLGTFKTRAAAQKHEREIQYFKRH